MPLVDPDFVEVTIAEVQREPKGWNIKRSHGWSFWVPEGTVEPTVGAVARFYPAGGGSSVRGLLIDGAEIFYRTKAEDREFRDVQLYGRDGCDLLERWDAGRIVWSVEMGGLGPGYEQAIQIAAFEALRWLVANRPDPSDLFDPNKWEVIRTLLEVDTNPVCAPFSLSGAQWAAALWLAAHFYRDGPRAVHEQVKDDRHIQVSRFFPSLLKPLQVAPVTEPL